DFGIRGFDLAFALLDGYEVTIFVDATSRGGEPGTLYTIEPDLNELDRLDARQMMVETHSMNPMRALGMAKSMGGEFKRILLVGCEPETLGPEEGQMGLSERVEAAADEAVSLIESLVTAILECDYKCGRSE
ncbi:MAG TPA: hydrogenase maturation protease, partial [Blastocatellia bacterium]|nr:hydrogenase maturation protease [Blastocatellia bacterium]